MLCFLGYGVENAVVVIVVVGRWSLVHLPLGCVFFFFFNRNFELTLF